MIEEDETKTWRFLVSLQCCHWKMDSDLNWIFTVSNVFNIYNVSIFVNQIKPNGDYCVNLSNQIPI